MRNALLSHRRRQLMLQGNQWSAVNQAEGWKTCKKRETDRNGCRFGAGLGGSGAFVSISFQKNLESEFLYSKVLFIPEIMRDNGFLCLLVIPRGLLGSIGFGDTWRFSSPLILKVVIRLECSAGRGCMALPPRFVERACRW